jgi:hypothetical protein
MADILEEIKQRYRRFADDECGEYGALYFKLSHAVALDSEILRFLAELMDRQPNLFFAAVHYLTGSEKMPSNSAELSVFVRENRDALAVVMRSHHTQTNEVGRCAVILPALPKGPLALIEVGASAGLCLMLDKYRYDYGATRIGNETSPVLLRCALETPVPFPLDLPEIIWRRGLDIDPIDLNDPKGVRWLLACVWADHVERRRRLQAAIELCQKQPPVIKRGDMVDELPRLIEEAPNGALLVIFHSAVFPYVPAERRAAFLGVLAEASHRRDIVWLSNEGPRAIPELDALAPERKHLRFRLGRTHFSKGHARRELLALCHHHGWDLEWLAPAAP